MQNLAEKLIARKDAPKAEKNSGFSVEDAPSIILEKRPAIYTYRNTLFHEHTPIKYNDVEKIYQLLDMHDAKLTKAQAIWIYNRLMEMAPPLEDRYILVSSRYLWDKERATLVPVSEFPDITTQSDATTKRIRQQQLQPQGEENGRMGQNLFTETY